MRSGPPRTNNELRAPGRRAAIVLVMTIAAGATVATSPGAPSIHSQVTRIATLDATTPVLVQRVRIRVSSEALVPETLYGGVKLSVPADGLGDRGARPILRVTAVPDDPALIPDSIRTEEDGGEFFSVASCPRGRPCEAEYSIVIEWLHPEESITLGWEMEASVSFGSDVPEGAEIEVLHLGDPETLAEPPPGLIPSNSPTPRP